MINIFLNAQIIVRCRCTRFNRIPMSEFFHFHRIVETHSRVGGVVAEAVVNPLYLLISVIPYTT